MAEKKPRKKQRSLDTTAQESRVLDAIQKTTAELNLQAIESGFRIDDEDYLSRVDDKVGFWKVSHRGKVSRILIHVVPDGKDYRLEFPAQDVSRHFGGANTKTGPYPKACLVFRVVLMAKEHANKYRRVDGWSWILYFVLEKHLPSKLNSSEAIRAISLADGTLGAGDYTFGFSTWGLVGVLKPDTTIEFFDPPRNLMYGDVTRRLADLLQRDRAPQAEDKTGGVQGSLLQEDDDEE
jgi:hypothetical protein